ncbi:MAG: hypothetical protein QM718_09815 [Steroidobacteraceae bacterium]
MQTQLLLALVVIVECAGDVAARAQRAVTPGGELRVIRQCGRFETRPAQVEGLQSRHGDTQHRRQAGIGTGQRLTRGAEHLRALRAQLDAAETFGRGDLAGAGLTAQQRIQCLCIRQLRGGQLDALLRDQVFGQCRHQLLAGFPDGVGQIQTRVADAGIRQRALQRAVQPVAERQIGADTPQPVGTAGLRLQIAFQRQTQRHSGRLASAVCLAQRRIEIGARSGDLRIVHQRHQQQGVRRELRRRPVGWRAFGKGGAHGSAHAGILQTLRLQCRRALFRMQRASFVVRAAADQQQAQ